GLARVGEVPGQRQRDADRDRLLRRGGARTAAGRGSEDSDEGCGGPEEHGRDQRLLLHVPSTPARGQTGDYELPIAWRSRPTRRSRSWSGETRNFAAAGVVSAVGLSD